MMVTEILKIDAEMAEIIEVNWHFHRRNHLSAFLSLSNFQLGLNKINQQVGGVLEASHSVMSQAKIPTDYHQCKLSFVFLDIWMCLKMFGFWLKIAFIIYSHSPWRKSKGEKNVHNFWHQFWQSFTKGNLNWGVLEMWDWSFLHNCKKVIWNLKKIQVKCRKKA